MTDVVIDIDKTTAEERLERELAITGGVGADVVVEAAGSSRSF